MEKLGSRPVHPTDACLREVENCDVFTGIYAYRYGSFARGLQSGKQLSLTEMEFEHARKQPKRCLCFIAVGPGEPPLELRPPVKPDLPDEPQPTEPSIPPPLYRAPEGIRFWLEWIGCRLIRRKDPLTRQVADTDRYINEVREYQHQWREENRQLPAIVQDYIRTTNEKLGPYFSDYEDYKTQYERRGLQEKFKKKVGDHFLYDIFSTPQELVDKVRRALDWLEKGEIIGFSPIDIFDRWQSWLQWYAKRVQRHQLYERPLLTSPLEELLWKPLSEQQPWHEETRKAAIEVQSLAQHLSRREDLKQLLQPLTKFPEDETFDKNYDEICSDLKRWCSRETVARVETRLESMLEEEQNEQEQLAPSVQDELEQLDSSSQDQDELEQDLSNWRKATDRLTREVDEPRFNRCFLVMGRTGAGKTHFVAKLLEQSARSGASSEAEPFMCLPLGKPRPFPNKKWDQALEGMILEEARLKFKDQIVGPNWRSLAELNAFLRGTTRDLLRDANSEPVRRVRLAIIFDDLDSWIAANPDSDFLNNLRDFVRDRTHLHALYWGLTLPESSYDLVIEYEEDFWLNYGYLGPVRLAGQTGWLSLDHANESGNLWRPIFEHADLDLRDVEESGECIAPATQKLLSNPFVAWTAAELIRDQKMTPREVCNLNYIVFWEEFWKRRLKTLRDEDLLKLEDGRTLRTEMKRSVRLIAERFVAGSQTEFYEFQLMGDLSQKDGGRSGLIKSLEAEKVVNQLARANLLRRPPELGETSSDRRSDERTVSLGFMPFWRYQGAKWLVERMKEHQWNAEYANQWVHDFFVVDGFGVSQPGMFEFMILVLDQSVLELARGQQDVEASGARIILQNVTEEALARLVHLRPEVWLAASKSSAEYQYDLAEWLEGADHIQFPGRHDLFLYMYFLKNARLPRKDSRGKGIPLHLRFKLLEPYYPGIEERRLGRYFNSLLQHLSETQDGQEIAKALAYLRGSESFVKLDSFAEDDGDIAKVVAYLGGPDDLANPVSLAAQYALGILWERALYAANAQKTRLEYLTEWMIVFVREVSQLLDQKTSQGQDVSELRRDEELAKFWGQLVFHFCKVLVEHKGLEALDWLDAYGWFFWSHRDFDVNPLVRRVMEDGITTSLGAWFRRVRKTGAQNHYANRVENLSRGRPTHKLTAFYLIYHAVPSIADDPKHRRLRHPKLKCILETLRWDPDMAPVWAHKGLLQFYELQGLDASM